MKRRLARQVAFQCLFAWHVGQNAPDVLLARSLATPVWRRADAAYARQLVQWVMQFHAAVKADVAKLLSGYVFDELTLVEQVILLMSACEMTCATQTPVPVLINEAVMLCRQFGTQQGYRLVNAVLDRLANCHRPQDSCTRSVI